VISFLTVFNIEKLTTEHQWHQKFVSSISDHTFTCMFAPFSEQLYLFCSKKPSAFCLLPFAISHASFCQDLPTFLKLASSGVADAEVAQPLELNDLSNGHVKQKQAIFNGSD
jgi:hypothetical protein